MPILKFPSWHFFGVLVMLASVGCDSGSPTYKRIKELPYSEWDQYAETLPLEERLDLHKEIMQRSGHNPQMTIMSSFSGHPEETYRSIVSRLIKGDKSRYYISILYEINRSENFNICTQNDRKIVQNFLWSEATDAVKNESRPDFYRC